MIIDAQVERSFGAKERERELQGRRVDAVLKWLNHELPELNQITRMLLKQLNIGGRLTKNGCCSIKNS